MKSKPLKWIIWTGLAVALLLAVLSATVSFILPGYMERKLIPGLARDFGLTPDEVNVKRIGLWRTDIGPIRFLANNTPVITIADLEIDYSPLSLLKGQIGGIALGGLAIEIAINSEGIAIAGLQLPANTTLPERGGGTANIQTLLPIKLGHFSIFESRLEVSWNNRRYTIPIELGLQTKQLTKGILKGHAKLAIAGNPIVITASLDQMANDARIDFDIKKLSLDSLTQLGHLAETLKPTGSANFSGWGTFELEPFNLTGADITGQLLDTQIAIPDGVLENKALNREKSEPIVLTLKGESLSKLQWTCAPFRIRSRLNFEVNGLAGNLAYANEHWSLNSTFATLIPQQKLLENIDINTDLIMGGQVTARGINFEKGIEFSLLSKWDSSLITPMEGQKLASKRHNISINGHYQNSALTTEGKFTAEEIELVLPEGRLSTPLLNVESNLTLHPAESNLTSTITAHVTLPDVHSKFGSTAVLLPKIMLQATGKREPLQTWQFRTRTRLSNGSILYPPNRLQMTGLSMDLPLNYPDASAVQTGRIKVAEIKWDNRRMGDITGTLKQTSQGLTMALRHFSKLFPDMRVLVNGAIEKTGARINADIPPHHLVDEFDLGSIAPPAAGIRVTGQIGAYAELTIDRSGVAGSGNFKFNQGRVRQETQAILLDGINMEIKFDDLPKLKTAPQQRLHVDQLSFGDIAAEHLDVDFQVEGQQTLLINKAGINWSQGTINTSSIQITPGVEDYNATLICDRLNLAQVLEQLGVAQAKGEGSVSGRIPIRWANGNLSFDKGYLLSTPGRTGIIQLSGTEKLLVGLPPGTPQHTQLDIATEALKDYTYTSAKLNVQSEADHLLLKLQLDGKPNRLLPFAYDQSLGQFKRAAGEGQADFEGISIDFNFRSPLNEILNYKDLYQQQ